MQLGPEYLDKDAETPMIQTGNLAHNESCFDFKKHVETIVNSILIEGGYDVDIYQIKMNALWGQIISPPAHHYLHVHGNSVFSGFYVLKATENCPYPLFGDPRQGKLMGDLMAAVTPDVKACTQYIHFNNLNAGSLFLFNSWLPHQFVAGVPNSEVRFLHFVISAFEK